MGKNITRRQLISLSAAAGNDITRDDFGVNTANCWALASGRPS